MSSWVNLPDGRKVRQACGDVVVVDETVIAAHYGQLGAEIDAAALASRSQIEKEADLCRAGYK